MSDWLRRYVFLWYSKSCWHRIASILVLFSLTLLAGYHYWLQDSIELYFQQQQKIAQSLTTLEHLQKQQGDVSQKTEMMKDEIQQLNKTLSADQTQSNAGDREHVMEQMVMRWVADPRIKLTHWLNNEPSQMFRKEVVPSVNRQEGLDSSVATTLNLRRNLRLEMDYFALIALLNTLPEIDRWLWLSDFDVTLQGARLHVQLTLTEITPW